MKAQKLSSGKYRARAYDYMDSTGKQHYKSFTASTKKEAEFLAIQYETKKKTISSPADMTLGEAIDKYIAMQRPLLSETTIHAYERYRMYGFQDLMCMKLSKIDNLLLRDAVANECQRTTQKNKPISPKSVKNEYSLIESTLKMFAKEIDTSVQLPRAEKKLLNLPSPEVVYSAIKGTSVELPCLLAMWLSFSASEIKGLKRSSIHDGYIQIDQVMVRVGKEHIEKTLAKVDTRTRKHKIPEYIQKLIDELPADQEYLVPITLNALNSRLKKILEENHIEPFSFHKLRHINASTMALLQIPDKYAQERGGWSTDSTMKNVYQHTFSKARQEVDEKIDSFFNDIVGYGEKEKKFKYDEFCKLLKIPNNKNSMKLYSYYMTLI